VEPLAELLQVEESCTRTDCGARDPPSQLSHPEPQGAQENSSFQQDCGADPRIQSLQVSEGIFIQEKEVRSCFEPTTTKGKSSERGQEEEQQPLGYGSTLENSEIVKDGAQHDQ